MSLQFPQTARTAMDFHPEVELMTKEYNGCVLPCIDESSNTVKCFPFFICKEIFVYLLLYKFCTFGCLFFHDTLLYHLCIVFYMPRNHFYYFHYTVCFHTPLKIWDDVLTPKLILGRQRCNESHILRFEICIETD
jgi:hypothetical protein